MATKYAQQDGNWSDDIADTTWYDAESGGNAVDHPVEGDNAIINAGVTITIDDAAAATIAVGADTGNAIDVKGTLQYLSTATADHTLRCKGNLYITTGGSLQIGTVANPIPATRIFTIELNYSASLAEGKFGLLNYGEMIMQGASKTVKTLLTADLSAAGTVWTVGDTTNWEAGDRLAIASTTRTWSEAEDKVIQSVDSGTQVTMTAGATNAHSGTSPTQAEVINLTRNVKITSYDAANYRGYVVCHVGSTSDVDYVEFYMIGYNATYKHGIEIRTTAVDATNFAYCSVWGKAASNYPFYLYYAQNVVIDNCVVYYTDEEFLSSRGSDNSITNCIIMKIPDYGLHFYKDLSTFDNNIVTSCSNYGWYIHGYLSDFISFNNNIAHSCNMFGFSFDGMGITGSNIQSWRNKYSGIYFSNAIDISFENLTLFGNGNNGISIADSGPFEFTNIISNGDSTFSTPVGIYLGRTYGSIKITDSDFGTASGIKTAHTTADVEIASNTITQIIAKNTKLSSTTKVSNINNAIIGSYVQCEDLDQIVYNDKAWYKYGKVTRDSTTFKTGSYAMRFDQFWAATDWLEYNLYIPVKDGEQIVASVWLRKNASYTSANRPKIVLSGMGITEDEAQMSDVTDTWERVTVKGTPTRTGLAKLTIKTYLTNSGASAWADMAKTDILSGVLNTIEGDFWADGHMATVLMDTGSITAAEFWKTLLTDIDKAGSFGNLLEDNLDAQVSLIKTETDKIQTGIIDAKNDYKATGFATAAVCTEARLAELAAANLPADVDAILADTNELQNDIKKHDNKITGLLM